jgi:hypothetical protein
MGIQTPLTLEESLATFTKNRRKLYEEAYASLLHNPINDKDGVVQAFVKAEKFDPSEKNNPDPRMIQARSVRYNLELARYLRPIEHYIYGYVNNGHRSVAKCLNPEQRAELLLEKWATFKNPVCFSIDCSRWDKHVDLNVLKVEHEIYQACYPGDPKLAQLLKWQQKNRCYTKNGLKYKVVGGRMSGDMNTALGNCLLMVLMVQASMRALGIKQYQIMDDGDDCLVLVEAKDLPILQKHLTLLFLEFGQELKIENIARDFRDVVFCQARMTWNGQKWVFARNWRKVLSQTCCGTKHWNVPLMVPKLFGLIGDCEIACHAGIPILQEFGEQLRRLSGGKRAEIKHLDSSYQYRSGAWMAGLDLRKLQARPITIEARLEFERVWGVEPWKQLAIEQHLREWAPTAISRPVEYEMHKGWVQYLDPNIYNPQNL